VCELCVGGGVWYSYLDKFRVIFDILLTVYHYVSQ
jgi:hypothetical protein